jgi:hypothetical protein
LKYIKLFEVEPIEHAEIKPREQHDEEGIDKQAGCEEYTTALKKNEKQRF